MSAWLSPILVVEDIPSVRELLEVTLRFKGYPVAVAADGQEALEYIALTIPPLVITDILMPRIDGYALAFRLRRKAETRAIPIIFISATYITKEDKTFALSLGGVRFIEKPIDTEFFLKSVAEVLQQGPDAGLSAMDEDAFYAGYQDRLQNKLNHKLTQIERTRSLVQTLPQAQRDAYESMLLRALRDRDEIQLELDALQRNHEQRINSN